jgi:membrane protein implicated in regulation of membrane protease activity
MDVDEVLGEHPTDSSGMVAGHSRDTIARMDHSLAWAIVGFVLVITELMTGTFYLLMLGVAAFGAALVAWLGQDFGVQAVVAAVISALGCYGVHLYRAKNRGAGMAPIDAGMPATFEGWIDAGSRLARVRYRGATWDAQVEGAEGVEPGATLFVLAVNGNTLKISKSRPA